MYIYSERVAQKDNKLHVQWSLAHWEYSMRPKKIKDSVLVVQWSLLCDFAFLFAFVFQVSCKPLYIHPYLILYVQYSTC